MSIPHPRRPSRTKTSRAVERTNVMSIRSQFFLSFLRDNILAMNTKAKTKTATAIQL